MSNILKNLQQVRPLNSASVAAIVDVANDNFKKISQAVYAFLTNIQYDESTNSMALSNVDAAVITVNKKLSMLVNGSEMFSVDQSGRIWSKSYVAQDIIQTKRTRLTVFTGAPYSTIGGEIIYGQIYTDSGQTTLSPLDFWGYVQGLGWFSLTGYSGSGFMPSTSAVWAGQAVNILSAPPATPVQPGMYVVDWTTAGNLDFSGHEGEIASYDFVSCTWSFFTAPVGSAFTNLAEYDRIYVRQYGTPTVWAPAAGYSGYSGASGYSGYSGYGGASGYSGYSGNDGASGYSGYSGYSGNDGASGYSGYSGYGGTSGFSGQRGWSGYSGYSGASGKSGTVGISGYSGYSGIIGYSGVSGAIGYSGFSGEDGASGYSGYSGYDGASGYSGYSGNDGASGYSGYSGNDGASGYSGYSGNDGASGYSGYSGYSKWSTTTQTANYSANNGEFVIVDEASAGADVTIKLPAATSGSIVGVKKSTSHATYRTFIKTNASGVTIDDMNRSSTGISLELLNSGDSVVLVADGTNWKVESQFLINSNWNDVSPLVTWASTSTFTVADTIDNQETFKAGRPLKYLVNGITTYRYGIVKSYSGGTVTICGYPLTTSIQQMWRGVMSQVQVLRWTINGVWDDNTTTQLLLDENNQRVQWEHGKAHIVKLNAACCKEESGATKPILNIMSASNRVFSTGVTVNAASTWYDSGINVETMVGTYCEVLTLGLIEVEVETAGTNGDSTGLNANLTLVLE